MCASNELLTWTQRSPRRVVHRSIPSTAGKGPEPAHFRIVSDAAYKKETEDGYSLRGVLFCRGGGVSAEAFAGQDTPIHLIERVSKSQRHVARSTFSTELLSGGDAADQGIL
eukprot:890413-Lingulodinium_polyedra.AAC.1